MVKNMPANAEDMRETGIPGSRRSPGEGHGNPLQYSCLENPMDRRAFRARVHGVTNGWTLQITHAHTHTHTHIDTDMDADLAGDCKGAYLSFTSQPLPVCGIVL